MATRQQWATAIGGLGAGFQGKGSEWRRDQSILSKERKQALVSDFERANVFMQNGEFDRAISLMSNRGAELAKFGAVTDSTDYGIGLAEIGDKEGFATFANSIYQGAVTEGLVPPRPQGQIIPADAINEYGQVSTREPDGSISTSPRIEGYTPPASASRPFQQGQQQTLQDSEGVLFERASVFNPASGDYDNKYINLATGQDYTPVGAISGVNQSGQTPEQVATANTAALTQRLDIESSRAYGMDMFETLPLISKQIGLYDEALALLEADDGANTGAIMSRFPSFRGPTLALENVQQRLGLGIIAAVTFGALSEKELEVAMQVALPTGLDEPELIDWIKTRRSAERKLLTMNAQAARAMASGVSLQTWIAQQSELYTSPSWVLEQYGEEGVNPYETSIDLPQGENAQNVVEVNF